MGQIPFQPVIDFNNYIAERARNFTGRAWVFEQIDAWLADATGPRFFLLVGEPGSGKTALAARLCQFSQRIADSPYGLPHLTHDFLSAYHFCRADDSDFLDPLTFARSLALQLTRHPQYAQALLEIGEQDVNIWVELHIQEVHEGGAVQGVIIEHLTVANLNAQECFNRLVRDPLRTLYSSGFSTRITIVVDGLDEALVHPGRPTIVELLSRLQTLPDQVRFILTSRSDIRIEGTFPEAEGLLLSAPRFDQRNRKDISDYIRQRLASDEVLAEKIAHLETELVNNTVETLTEKAAGNFQYITFHLNSIARNLRTFQELDGLPEGLDNLYADSLDRVVQLGKKGWSTDYAPLIGVLSVAQEYLTFEQLQALTGRDERSVWDGVNDLQQFIESTMSTGRRGEEVEAFHLYHQSFIDFLRRRQRTLTNKKRVGNAYYLPAEEWHRQIAVRCEYGGLEAIWQDTNDPVKQQLQEYAQLHYITHLYHARNWERLFVVLDEGVYGRAKLHADPSTRLYAQDLDLGRRATAWEGWTLEQGIALLPRLWQYSLLRCSLRSRADHYPLSMYRVLLLLGREQEVLGLAELLTDPSFKAQVLLLLAEHLFNTKTRRRESMQLYLRVHDIAASMETSRRWHVLIALAEGLTRTEQWEQADALWAEAEACVHSIDNEFDRKHALTQLAGELIRARQLGRAERVIRSIKDQLDYVSQLSTLAKELIQSQQWERAETLWKEAESVAHSIEDRFTKGLALQRLASNLTSVEQWKWAEEVARSIEEKTDQASALSSLIYELARAEQWEWFELLWAEAETAVSWREVSPWGGHAVWRVYALSRLAEGLVKARQGERAEALWTEAEVWAHEDQLKFDEGEMLKVLVESFARIQQWERAEAVAYSIKDNFWRARALQAVAEELVKAQQWERAIAVARSIEGWSNRVNVLGNISEGEAEEMAKAQQWERAITVARSIENGTRRADALSKISEGLAREGQWERAKATYTEAEAVIGRIEEDSPKAHALRVLAEGLAKAQRLEQAEVVWAEAERVARSIEDERTRVGALVTLAEGLARAKQWDRAEVVWAEAERVAHSIEERLERIGLLRLVAEGLTRAGQKERAGQVWEEAAKGAYSIEKYMGQKFQAYRTIAAELVKLQQWERVEAVVSSIENIQPKIDVLRGVAEELVEVRQREGTEAVWAEIEKAARLIKDSSWGPSASQVVAEELAKAQQWERAEAVARSIEVSFWRASALQVVAEELAKARQWEQAEAIWAEVEKAAHSIEGYNLRASMWLKVAGGLARAERWERAKVAFDEAKTVISFVEGDFSKSRLLRSLGVLSEELAKSQQWEQAEVVWAEVEETTRSIEGERDRVSALIALAEGLGRVGQVERADAIWAEAEGVARSIKGESDRANALSWVAQRLAKTQQWGRAEMVANSINIDVNKVTALKVLADELANSQQWDQAEKIASLMLASNFERGETTSVASTFVNAGQWERAEKLAYAMQDSHSRIKVLRELVEALAEKNDFEVLLDVVQRAWLSREQRADALDSFPLAVDLIPLVPKIGTGFCEAFQWVDTFLSS